jgi:hypothetical protein
MVAREVGAFLMVGVGFANPLSSLSSAAFKGGLVGLGRGNLDK